MIRLASEADHFAQRDSGWVCFNAEGHDCGAGRRETQPRVWTPGSYLLVAVTDALDGFREVLALPLQTRIGAGCYTMLLDSCEYNLCQPSLLGRPTRSRSRHIYSREPPARLVGAPQGAISAHRQGTNHRSDRSPRIRQEHAGRSACQALSQETADRRNHRG